MAAHELEVAAKFFANEADTNVATQHKAAGVNDLQGIARALATVTAELPLVFPVHPRTRGNLERLGIDLAAANIHLMAPQAYMSFLNLWKDAVVVLSDSGGLQEETTALGAPCVTLRENTERPVTVDEGSNVLAGTSPERIVALALDAIRTGGRQPHLWDGNAAIRIVDVLAARLVA